jgi:hypothetical protein
MKLPELFVIFPVVLQRIQQRIQSDGALFKDMLFGTERLSVTVPMPQHWI